MAFQGVPQLAVGQVPDFDGSVPRGGHNCGLQGVWAEPDAADPIVVPILLLDCVLALSESVPELDRAVTRSGHDLTVVNGESHGEDVLGVANKTASRHAEGQVPETELAVPGAGESELAVG